MNRKIKSIFRYLFLIWTALTVTVTLLNFQSAHFPALPAWIDFIFFALAATVILFEAAAHVGWRPAWLAFLIVVIVGGTTFWFNAPRLGQFYTPTMGPLIANSLPLALPLLVWTLVGGFYLIYHRVLPFFDARIVSLLTAISTLIMAALLEPFASRIKYYWLWEQGSAPWLNYLTWLVLAFVLARFIPLKGNSKPVSCVRPLTVLLVMAALFLIGRI